MSARQILRRVGLGLSTAFLLYFLWSGVDAGAAQPLSHWISTLGWDVLACWIYFIAWGDELARIASALRRNPPR